MSTPRGLSREEAAAWASLAATVTPLVPGRATGRPKAGDAANGPTALAKSVVARAPSPRPLPVTASAPPRDTAASKASNGLDGHWERRLRGGSLTPDFTLDLHGVGLDAAYGRLMDGIAQARGMDARVVLVIAGKPRSTEAADRGTQRGAIRAKLLDWLAASGHHDAIAAVRKAHPRHGGEGAVYLVLKRR